MRSRGETVLKPRSNLLSVWHKRCVCSRFKFQVLVIAAQQLFQEWVGKRRHTHRDTSESNVSRSTSAIGHNNRWNSPNSHEFRAVPVKKTLQEGIIASLTTSGAAQGILWLKRSAQEMAVSGRAEQFTVILIWPDSAGMNAWKPTYCACRFA